MPLEGEAKKQWQDKYNKKKKEVEHFWKAIGARDKEAQGIRFKSEVESYESLAKIFSGLPHLDVEPEDIDFSDEDDAPKKRKSDKPEKPQKYTLPNPSKTEILGEIRSFDEWLELRDKARKNLFWLGQSILRHDFIPATHQIVCDQFVQKNFDGAFPAGYTIGDVHKAFLRQERYDSDGNPTREALIMDPRGFYKSTISRVDCIQWMLNVPDVRILLLTSEFSLAKAMMRMIKRYLCLSEGEKPTDLHLLFPEYILRGRDTTSGTPFVLSCRKHNQTEPTLWVKPIGANLAGWHCDVKKGDDVVTEKNCNTIEVRKELNEKYDGTANISDLWTFSDSIGTRYFGDPDPDWYGERIQRAIESPDSAIKLFVRQCWNVKAEYTSVPLKEITEDMVVLNFPEKATFKELRKKLLANEEQFRCQQLNEPAASDKDSQWKIHFDKDTLLRHMYNKESAPKEGDIYVAWDWALTANKQSDFSAGVAGRIYKRPDDGLFGLSILDIVCDKWTFSELPIVILNFNKKWQPKETLIERSGGADRLFSDIAYKSFAYGGLPNITLIPPSLEPNAKRNRIKSLEILLKDGRLWFVTCEKLDLAFQQMTQYTGDPKNRGRKDDIPDAMSYLCRFLPIDSAPDRGEAEQFKAMMAEARKRKILKEQHDRIFGSVPNTNWQQKPDNPDRGWQPKWPTKPQ